MRRQPKFEVQIEHPQPAYLDEYYPLKVKLINSESDDIQAQFSAELKMTGAIGERVQWTVFRQLNNSFIYDDRARRCAYVGPSIR
jgi:hypothetical protein